MRYLIGSEHGWLGGFGFGAAALQLADRDQWIGWDADTRRRHLNRVVGMSRFLIRTSVRCQNLASHVLAMVLRRLGADYEEAQYGYRPWLVESFVDTQHFIGTSSLARGEPIIATGYPYEQWAGHFYQALPHERLVPLGLAAARLGIRVCTLVCYELERVLRAFEEIDALVSIRQRRGVAVHVTEATPEQIRRIKTLELVATVTPTLMHMAKDRFNLQALNSTWHADPRAAGCRRAGGTLHRRGAAFDAVRSVGVAGALGQRWQAATGREQTFARKSVAPGERGGSLPHLG